MFGDAVLIAKYLPPAVGIIILVVGAGFMGIFRASRIQKSAFSDSVDSLMRQLDIVKEENELLLTQIDTLHTQIEVLQSVVEDPKEEALSTEDIFAEGTRTNPLVIRPRKPKTD